jgi:hypothetical protein
LFRAGRCSAGDDGEFVRLPIIGGSGDVRVKPLDAEARRGELPFHLLRRKVLKPVVNRSYTTRLDDGVLVQDDLFAVVLEGIEESIVFPGRPESVEEIGFKFFFLSRQSKVLAPRQRGASTIRRITYLRQIATKI